MKRITFWMLGTVSVLVLLFGYHTSTSGTLATGTPTSLHSGSFASSTGPSGMASTQGTSKSPKSSSTKKKVGQASAARPVKRKVTGSVASTRWGPVQVALTVTGGKVVEASVLQYPHGNDTDAEINDHALPILTHETIDAQSAKIDMVSGATVTSGGYLQSLQSALDRAHL